MRTTKNAVTPRSVKQLSRAVYTVTNPLGAAENALIGAALYGGRSGSRSKSRASGGRSAGIARSTDQGELTASSVRAAEGAASHRSLSQMMNVQRERFTPVHRPAMTPPVPPALGPLQVAEWELAKKQTRPWQRKRRAQLRIEADARARAQADLMHQQALAAAGRWQEQADAWWRALGSGQTQVLTQQLEAAFSDNVAPVLVISAEGSQAVLALSLPGLDVLPERKPHITPGGKLSSKAWTQTELAQVYADLLGAHLLATFREAWAVAPSLQTVRVLGSHELDTHERPSDGLVVLLDVTAGRSDIGWPDDAFGSRLTTGGDAPLRRTGRTSAVTPWPEKDLPVGTAEIVRKLREQTGRPG